MRRTAFSTTLFLVVFALSVQTILAQTTEFSFQGNLKSGGTAANGNFDFEFALFDALAGGAQLGSTITLNSVAVADGIFSVRLDFGNQFTGGNRFLEIRVRQTGGGAFTPLNPRQMMNSGPYSIKSLTAENATTAANALQLGGVSAGQYVLTGDARLSDARNPLPNSTNYVQNTTTEQSSSNFFISGNGRASIFDASTQFNLGGARVLFATSSFNTFTGFGSGAANTTGNANSFFGYEAGKATTLGFSNSFFGASTGLLNTTGSGNSAFGNLAGWFNTTGENNTFLGLFAGSANVDGSGNTFLGTSADALFANLTNATAIGFRARVGQSNSLVLGSINGIGNATADTNVGIGTTAPTQRLHVVGNGLFTGNLTVTGTFTGNVSASGITGVLGASNGGTGLSLVGAAGNFLRSNGTIWSSSPIAPTDIPAGNAFYIQNGTTLQGATNFNISGTGNANILNAGAQFNLGGSRVLFAQGIENLFVGLGAGQSNTTGYQNSFFGYLAGASNTTGESNAYFGNRAGLGNTTGLQNSFFGANAGIVNTTGNENAFFGYRTGFVNTTGYANAFFGKSAGAGNTAGFRNSFLGFDSGYLNTTGFGNVFLGNGAGYSNTTGDTNTMIGYNADVVAGNLANATAIGGYAFVSQSNSMVLGSINGVNGASFDTNVGIGTTAPTFRTDIFSSGDKGLRVGIGTTSGTVAQFGAKGYFFVDLEGIPGGRFSISENGNVGIGVVLAQQRLQVAGNGVFSGSVGIGTTAPQQVLHVNGNEILSTGFQAGFKFRERNSVTSADDWVLFSEAGVGRIWRFGAGDIMTFTSGGLVGINFLGAAGSTALCRNASNQISTCSSSIRYKSNVTSFTPGLDLVRRLRPISFNWKEGGMLDFGLVAEDVAAVEPLLTTTNDKGEIEGVKYDRVGVVLVNAVNEQQVQIESLQKQIDEQKEIIRRQQAELDALKKLICALNQAAGICAPKN